MRPNPVISIVCHVLAQSVCTNRNINAPNRKTNFPVFFSLGGLIGTCEAPSAFSPCENLIQESQPPHWNL